MIVFSTLGAGTGTCDVVLVGVGDGSVVTVGSNDGIVFCIGGNGGFGIIRCRILATVYIAIIVSSLKFRFGWSWRKEGMANVDIILSTAVVRRVDNDIVGKGTLCRKTVRYQLYVGAWSLS